MKKLVLLIFISAISGAYAQKNLTLLGSLVISGQQLSGCWHYNHSSGKEYAIVGATDGIAIVDISNPATPNLLFQLPGASSLWHEVKVLGDYAYAVSEGFDTANIKNGVQVISLRYLPDSAPSFFYRGDGVILNQINTAHTIAANGNYIYVNGHNITSLGRGVLIIDVSNPQSPVYKGAVTARYCHDSYVRDTLLFTSDIGDKLFSVYGINNPASPVLLATQLTPGQFNHNTWLNDAGNVLFTTDEKTGAPLGSFDVSDLNNITLLDTFYNGNFTNNEVHNVRVKNDFLINPSYGSQLTLADASHPDNIIEVGNYPTGSSLCWDADPYLNSGNIIATDMNNDELFIFSPEYIRACYLEGTVTDSVTGLPLAAVDVNILSAAVTDITDFSGVYKTGYADSGSYTIQFTKTGYFTKQISVNIQNGNTTNLDVKLVPLNAGVKEISNESVSLFPNPAIDAISIIASDEITGWKITDKLGRVVASSQDGMTKSKKITAGISQLPAGNYSVVLSLINGSVSKSFIKR